MLVNSQIKADESVRLQSQAAGMKPERSAASQVQPNRAGVAAYEAAVGALFARAPSPVVVPEVEPGHELGNVVGTNIDMKAFDHTVAGAINGALAFAVLDEASGIGSLTIRKYLQTIHAEFKRDENKKLCGTIVSGEGETLRKTTISLAGLDTEKRIIKLLINGKEHQVTLKPEKVVDGHMWNTTFSTQIDGKPVSFKLDGAACFGLSSFMSMMILGAYVH